MLIRLITGGNLNYGELPLDLLLHEAAYRYSFVSFYFHPIAAKTMIITIYPLCTAQKPSPNY